MMVMKFDPHPDQPTVARHLTEDEYALARWLEAERQWYVEVAEWERKKARQAEYEQRQREREAEQDAQYRKVFDAHLKVVESASGFRRAALERHAPVQSYGSIHCDVCLTGDYDGGYCSEDFPCEEYDHARDWKGDE